MTNLPATTDRMQAHLDEIAAEMSRVLSELALLKPPKWRLSCPTCAVSGTRERRPGRGCVCRTCKAEIVWEPLR